MSAVLAVMGRTAGDLLYSSQKSMNVPAVRFLLQISFEQCSSRQLNKIGKALKNKNPEP